MTVLQTANGLNLSRQEPELGPTLVLQQVLRRRHRVLVFALPAKIGGADALTASFAFQQVQSS